jgi:hypothetical protein
MNHTLKAYQANGAEVRQSAIVAGHYHDARNRSAFADGERRLLLAVLKTAISDYLQGSELQTGEGRRRYFEVGDWISRKSPASGVFAYQEVCESLGIDPDRLRKRLSWLASQSTVPRLRSLPVLPAGQLLRVRATSVT